MKFLLRHFPGIKQYTLSYRLLVYVVLCSSIFALLATATQLYLDYHRDVSALYESIRFIKKSYLHTIAASTFKIDTDHLQLELEGALKLPDIVYLEVRELRGNQIYTYAKGNPHAAKIIRKELPLEYISPGGEKRLMGNLIVMASLEGVYQRLWSRVLTILVTNMVKTFLASACIMAIIYLLITRHLTRMADFTRHLIPGKQNPPFSLNRSSHQTEQPDELEHVVLAINDLQERAAADIIKQRQAELKYRTVADFTYDWEYWESCDGKLQYVSPSCERISSYSAQEFKDNPSLFREIIVSEDKGIWDEHYHDSREELKQRELHFRIQRRDGRIRWIEHACQPVYDGQGNPLGFRASNRDITGRKLAAIDLQEAYTKIEQLKNQLEAETTYLQEEIKLEHDFESIIGNSPALKHVLFKVEQVADTETTVLVLGETGTGKELVARAIHNRSLRNQHPLVKVNCAALPSSLIESELFGHEPGAFTGARTRQIGRFEIADGTSIFLDEIGDLPLELQTKFLQVLQDREFERLGSPRTIKVDVRVIAATNRDLEDQVRKGAFREDLFYRLNVFPFTVPPLRERVEDIPLLAEFFMQKAAKRLGKSITVIPTSVMNTLKNHLWPGNIRELENMIERAVINSSGPKLRLVEELKTPQKDLPTTVKTMKAIEFDHIMRVLEHTNWKISGKNSAADILGLKRGTLIARMKKLGIRKN